MRHRLLIVLSLVLALLVAGCGGGGSSSTTAGAGAGTTSTPTSTSDTAATGASSCPTENTKNFAKTRFVADVGGALFLANRYLLQPYKAGKFEKGANGRTFALVKAAAAAAASAKLLKNARENALANPTLCKTLAEPLGKVTSTLDGLVGGLRSGNFDVGALAGLSGLFSTLQSGAKGAGLDIVEKQVGL